MRRPKNCAPPARCGRDARDPSKELPLIIKLHQYRPLSAADKAATGGHNVSASYFEQGMEK
jgi:hypothetical protein